MVKQFPDFPAITDVLDDDVLTLWRGGMKKIPASVLIAGVVASITAQLLGKLGIDLTITRTVGGTATDLDKKTTTSLSFGYLLLVVINDELHVYQYQSPVASGDDIIPLDNPTHRWRRVM